MKSPLLLILVLLVCGNLCQTELPEQDGKFVKILGDVEEDGQTPGIFNIWYKSAAKPRRYDIRDLGYDHLAHGWFDVQGQGAANDYCRFVGNSPNIFLSCALAGTHGESEYNFNSQKSGFDKGYEGTGYVKDEDRDGRDDYCRCVGGGDSERIECAKAGPNGFYGSDSQSGSQFSFSPSGPTKCSNRKVRAEFGMPASNRKRRNGHPLK